MSLRRLVTVLLVVPAFAGSALTSPAVAGPPPPLVAENEGLAGIIAISEELSGGFRVNASCTFAGVLTPANTLVVEYGGTATASGPASNPNRTAPLLTAIFCEINNASEGGSNSQAKNVALNGAASAVADSTLLAESGPKEWPVKEITVCVKGLAVWGPVPVTVTETSKACVTPG